ncbi:hemagglutinin repeat-containing protein [Acinetobacter wuhouensis]|uniref:Filamentous hemagglutinin N-terminal domain-containing protein n=1 Tax=Acinetobacter wuhouensis TaxID=1879050 RepID=A0A3G2T6S7_9GAMM|nr:filamentous hemagglutinin N-terminal domain-containing protein [Acinetobacter wuhouensis]
MNKNRYRIIFSQARGMFIAVAEIVKSKTKAAGQTTLAGDGDSEPTASLTLNTYKRLNPINFAVISLLGAAIYTLPMASIAGSQIVADKSAPNSQQATILNTSNGLTQVNIQTPSAGGVSRNTYTQFDVGQEGAVLNNSRNNVQTQIGGWVQGNPWLAKGEAKVILNEVNSSNPSQLKGYLEVAGKQAQVVIANPSGLVCDGCGVINADRFTLTTGQAVMNQGYLESFRVREGQVTIEGKGLNGSMTPYTDIYTRALNVNAGLYANELKTVLGQNDINLQDPSAPQVAKATTSGTATTQTSPQPSYALDVGQLGGMYAGKIYLIGTENGLGVRNAGSINATSGSMTLNANGDLSNTGNIIANKDQIAIQAQNFQNSGNISSTQSKIQLDATDIQNSGLIATSDELKLNAQGNINNNNGVINAGRLNLTAQNLSNNTGKIEQTGQQQLNIIAKNLDNTQGLIGQATQENSAGTGSSTGGTTTPTVTDPEKYSSAQDASTVTVAPTESSVPKTFAAGNIQIAQDIQNIAGQIVNNADINLNVQDSIKNNGGEIQLPELQFNGQNFENQAGKLTAKVVNITAQNADNQKGLIDATDSFDLNAQQLKNNEGRLQSAKALNLNTNQIDNSKGQILATDTLTLGSEQTNNTEGVIGSVKGDAQLNIKTLNNNKGEISAQNVQLTGQTLNNQQGSIQAKTGDLTLKVDQIDNGRAQDAAGNFTANKNLSITAQQLNSTGQIYAGDTADLTVKQLQQDGQLAALNKIKVQSDNITSNKNAIWAAGLDSEGKLSQSDATLNIDAQQAQIAGTVLSGESVAINATKNADLSQSATQAKNIQINTQELNTSNAKIIADQQLDLIGKQSINNQQGQYSAVQVNIDTAQLNNDQGLIQHTGQHDFILNVANRIDNNAGKIISNANNTEIKTANLNSVAGEILHAGDQQLKITAQNLQGQQGKIQSNQNVQLELGTAHLDNATTAAKNINLNATTLSHKQGQLIQSEANGQLNVNVAQALDNTSGVISAAGQATLNTADLNNQQGVIQTLADKDLKITSQKLDNQSGKIIAGRDANLQVSELNNDQGTVYADGKLDLQATQDIYNQQGLIASQQALSIKGQNLNNQKGQIQSEQSDVHLNLAQSINNQSGSIQSAQALNIQSPHLENKNGQLVSGTDSQINANQLNNQAGTIYSKKQLDVTVSGTADNSAGTIAAEQNLNLNAQQLLNDAGQIRSENADTVLNVTQDISNNTGLISADKDLTLNAQNVHSQKGKLQSGANATVQVNSIDNSEGVIYAAEQLQLNATGELNNSKGVVAAEQLADLKAGSVMNDAGQIRSQQDQLKFNVQNELSNLAGEISAEKAIELTANKLLNNQNGKVIAGSSLKATTQQIDNNTGTIYAKDQLNLNVADRLNNQSGTIAANQQVQIQANSLNNNAGKIRSEQNQLDLNVKQTLDNQSGEIFAGTHANINATTLNNQQGTIYAKNQLDLKAGQLNNQQGQVYSEGSANVTVQGNVQNQKGVIVAGQSLAVQSQNLDNTEGTLRSEKADLTLNTQGQLINQQGDIYAGQNANLNTQSLINNAGQIASQNQLNIDTQQQQLSNQNGKIIAKVVDLKTGTLDNQAGLIQGEQSVKVDTQNHALLNNNSGDQAGILSQGSLEIANVSQLDNISGYIAAVGSTNITAQNLNNNKGQINSQADLSIQQQASGGRIDNLAGQIQAQHNLNLNTDTINNSGVGSHLVAGEKLTANTTQLINSQTKDATTLGGIDAKNIELNAAELNNQLGAIRATDQANLNISNQLNNQAGSISSLDTLNIGTPNKTLNINNTGGELLAKNQLNLKANELINKGKIISEGNIDIDLKQSYTHTKDDQIAANGTLKLNTDNDLINQSELTAGQKLELSAKNIKNEVGATISSNETHLTAQDTVHNQGLINGELTHIQADRVWNDGARIYGTHVAIQANTLDNKSNTAGTGAVIASRGDMDLGIGTLNNQSGGVVKESARDNAWIFSVGNLNVGGSLDGNLNANGQANTINNLSARIESLGDMTLTAKNINNINQNFQTDIVQIGGVEEKVYIQPKDKTTLIPVENLYWKNWSRAGLYRYDTTPNVLPENIKLGETPIPNVESINCVGTGDDESCNVNYKKADPVWAYFNITPPTQDAPEAPTLVEPVPPTGQASCEVGVGYDATACTAYQTAYTQYEKDKQAYDQAQLQYKKDLDAWSESDESAYQKLDEAIQAYNLKFGNTEIKAWTQYDVKETKSESKVTVSAPAEIVAGGNINLFADTFTNDKSVVLAGGKLNAELKNDLVSIDGKGQQIIKRIGESTYTYSNWRGGFKRYHERKYNKSQPYNPSDEIKEIDLPINQFLGNIQNHTSNQNITATTTSQNVVVNSSVDTPDQQQDRQQQSQQNSVNTDAGQAISALGQQAKVPQTPDQLDVKAQVDSDVESQQQQAQSVDSAKNLQAGDTNTSGTKAQGDIEIRSVSMETLNLPSNALFSTNQDSQAKYLVETDPAFINYKNWLSSDYMLDAMNIDPALKQKRMGDGYYEQRLVQDQIAQLTGFRFLQGYANDEDQYKALMNNGLTFANLYNLRPGIALTAAQIAQLTTDIVWLEEKTVKLADGTTTKALVPQVYVKARQGDLKGDGSLLSGSQVQLQVDGNVLNSATIAGREALKISADSINQLGGRMQANRVDLTTTKDLNNIGGTITAIESAKLTVGGNFNQSSTTQKTANKVGDSEFTRGGFDRKAGLYVVGSPINTENLSTTLIVDVAGNTTLKGSEIINSNGSSIIKTQGDLKIGGVNTSVNNRSYGNQDNYNYNKQQQDVGSVIQSKGDTRLQAENITVKGSQISSEQGSTILSAQQKIDISEGRKISDAETAYKTKDKSTFSTTTEKGRVRNMSDEAIASSINGKNVILSANNIDIQGTNIVSDDLTQIQAKENINISAAENHYVNELERSKKTSGFTSSFSDGVASVGYGKSSNQNKQNNQSTTLTQSQIVSLQGNTNILAGKDLTAEAAILGAGKDLNLQGENVNLNAGYETTNQHSESQSKSSGVSVGVTYSPIVAAASTYKKNAESDQYSDSAVGKVMSRADAIDKATQAAITPIVVTAGSHKSNQTSDYSKTNAVVTQASAQGNLNIIATEGNINSQGAQLSAEGDALLHAKDSINLSYATDQEQQTANSQQSGFSIDNRNKFAPAGVYNNKNQGNGNIDKVTGTQLSSGGKTTLQTETGDINILGSSVAATGDVNINAARDVNIKSTQNSQSQSESSSNKGIGSAQISDTEQFYGYMKGQSQSSSNGIEQQRSQVGSLEGNVNIHAGNNYNQQVADIIAKKDINIDAKQINVLEDHNTGQSSSSADDLKVGVFKRISSPILDLLGAGDKVAKSKGDDRTQALQGLAAGAQAYQSYSDIKGGAVIKAEAGIGFSTSENQQTSRYASSQQNKINAGGNVNLTSTEGNIHLQNTQVKAGDTIQLDSAKDILLESGQSQEKAKGSNSNAGLSVGYGASVGAQTGVYIYGEAGYGKGSNHTDNNTHNLTTLESDKLILKSKGDTTLNGAQATANRIDTDVGGKLSIISTQDTVDQKIDQTGIGGRVQASLGTAWQVSGNYSNSNANGKSNSVNQQSGLFAGDGGYHVKADSVDLKGGAIVSTASKDKNDLTVNSLTFSNIENQSAYDATSVALSGGTKVGQYNGNGQAPQPTSNENWRNSTSFSPSLPQYDSDKDKSTTYATLSAGNITIGGKQTTVEELGIHSNIATANRKVDTLPNLQDILEQQKTVADATSTITAAARTYAQDQVKNATAEKETIENSIKGDLSAEDLAIVEKMSPVEQDRYFSQYSSYVVASSNEKDVTAKWGMGGDNSRALNAVTLAIVGALGGQTDVQVASNALAPYASQLIGQTFGHGEDKNTTAQMVSHAILGATLAYVNGGNPTAGGSAAVASEAAATYFANKYNDGKTAINPNTGKFDPNLLPEGVKTSIRDLTAAIGVAVGGTVGDSAFNAQIAGVVGQNAVENNEFSIISQGIEKKLAENKKKDEAQPKFSCPKGQSCIIPIPEKTMGEKAIGIINDLTVRQLAAALGAEYDPLTKEFITPNERQLAKASMLSLGFSKTLSGPIKLTEEAMVALEVKIGKVGTQKLLGLPVPKSSQLINMDKMDPHEIAQAQSIINLKGGIFEGTPSKRYPGIDGWLNGVPVQLKEVTGNSLNSIQKNILKADASLKKHGYEQAELYIDAIQTRISREQLNDFIKKGTPISNVLNEGAVKSISINTKDGWLIINRTNMIK